MRRNFSSAAVAFVTTYLYAKTTLSTTLARVVLFPPLSAVLASSFISNTNGLLVTTVSNNIQSHNLDRHHHRNPTSSILLFTGRSANYQHFSHHTQLYSKHKGDYSPSWSVGLFDTTIPSRSAIYSHPEEISESMMKNNSAMATDDTMLEELLLDMIFKVARVQDLKGQNERNAAAVNGEDQNSSSTQIRVLANNVVNGAQSLKSIASTHTVGGGKSKKETWMSLQKEALSLLQFDLQQHEKQSQTTEFATPELVIALTAAGLFAVLALSQGKDGGHGENENQSACRAAASAAEVIISKQQKQLRSSTSNDNHSTQIRMEGIVKSMIGELLLLASSGKQCVDLHIVTSLARAFAISGGIEPDGNDLLSEVSAAAIRHALRFADNNNNSNNNNNNNCVNGEISTAAVAGNSDNEDTSIESAKVNVDENKYEEASDMSITTDSRVPSKQDVAGALALAAQLGPWNHISPLSLVETAIVPYDLWHQAELVCDSASTLSSTKSTFEQRQPEEATKAIHALIDAALEARSYRRADAFATQFYNVGGKSRYIEARFLHACSTIGKVVRKRQLPIIERQVERVDKAVGRVCGENDTDGISGNARNTAVKSDNIDTSSTANSPTASVGGSDDNGNSAKNEIRSFALRQLEEAGEFDGAQRLAQIWGVEYEYDEETVLAAAAARRRRYIQWEDIMPSGTTAPDLLSTPQALMHAFHSHKFHDYRQGPFGFDAEWGDDHAGTDILQIATTKVALLVDIPALSETAEGTDALEQTVGRLFACPNSVVVGFSCRQDLSRLRSSPCCGAIQRDDPRQQQHWFTAVNAVVDAQVIVGEKEPKLKRLGLSRVCEHYLGKPLDKAEQCSLWTARPLSTEQRVYAALDAWACAAIHEKIFPKSTN